jgi:DNA-binding beta-propeller fold protein YncE
LAGAAEATGSLGGFNAPAGIALDGAGNLFVADQKNDRVVRVDRLTGGHLQVAGLPTTVAYSAFALKDGDAPATVSALFAPTAVAWRQAGPDEELFVLDAFHQRIRRVTAPGGDWNRPTMRTIAGSGTPVLAGDARVVPGGFGGDGDLAVKARFHFARVDTGNWRASEFPVAGMVLDPGRSWLYVADPINRRVRGLDLDSGTVWTVAGGGYHLGEGLASNLLLESPAGLATLPGGDLLVADSNRHVIRRIVTAD